MTSKPIRATVWNEFRHEQTNKLVQSIYPKGIHITIADHTPAAGFRAGLVFYAGCGLREKYKSQGFKPYTSVLEFHGTADEETGFNTCRRLVDKTRAAGGDIELVSYDDATHDFDDPGRKRQSVPANQQARTDAIARATSFFEGLLAQGLPPRR